MTFPLDVMPICIAPGFCLYVYGVFVFCGVVEQEVLVVVMTTFHLRKKTL